jgi:hypothetical protein
VNDTLFNEDKAIEMFSEDTEESRAFWAIMNGELDRR